MKKFLLILLLIALLVGGAYRFDYGPTRDILESLASTIVDLDKAVLDNKSVALREARIVVQRAMVNNGGVLETSPCLSDVLVPGWSLDIVHAPREEVDDQFNKQCASFLSGETQYLIEYDTLGNFVQIVERN